MSHDVWRTGADKDNTVCLLVNLHYIFTKLTNVCFHSVYLIRLSSVYFFVVVVIYIIIMVTDIFCWVRPVKTSQQFVLSDPLSLQIRVDKSVASASTWDQCHWQCEWMHMWDTYGRTFLPGSQCATLLTWYPVLLKVDLTLKKAHSDPNHFVFL